MRNSGRSPPDSVSADPLAAHHLRDLVTRILYFAESSVETAVTSRRLASASSPSPKSTNLNRPAGRAFVSRRICEGSPGLCSLNQIEDLRVARFYPLDKNIVFPAKIVPFTNLST